MRRSKAAPVKRPENAAVRTDEMLIELTVEADGKSDVLRRRLPIQPYGLPVYNIAGGSAAADTTAWVEAPANVADDARSLQILLGPTVERSLLDVLFAPAPICQIDNIRRASSLDTATSDALALSKLLANDDTATTPVQAIDTRLRSTVSLLVAAQNDDGGWSWTGQKGTASHRYTSARVVRARALARKAGYRVPDDGFNNGCNFLASEVAKTRHDDYESKAICCTRSPRRAVMTLRWRTGCIAIDRLCRRVRCCTSRWRWPKWIASRWRKIY